MCTPNSSTCPQATRVSHNWAETFTLPERFSSRTMAALKNERLTKAARIEIVASMHMMMIQHSDYPTATQYKTACTRMVKKYPVLADKIGTKIVSHEDVCMYKCVCLFVHK